MHMLGGYHEISRQIWEETPLRLSGQFQRAAGMKGTAFLYVPDGYRAVSNSASIKPSDRLNKIYKNLSVYHVEFKDPQVDWAVGFERKESPAALK
jgi:hypothetical protein